MEGGRGKRSLKNWGSTALAVDHLILACLPACEALLPVQLLTGSSAALADAPESDEKAETPANRSSPKKLSSLPCAGLAQRLSMQLDELLTYQLLGTALDGRARSRNGAEQAGSCRVRSERARERGLKRSAGSIARVLLDTVAAGAWSGDGVRSSSRAWSGRGGAAAGWMGCERTESGSATASRDGKEGMADVPRWPVLHLLVVGSAGEVVVALRPACRAASSEASRAGRRRRPRCRRVRGRARACAGRCDERGGLRAASEDQRAERRGEGTTRERGRTPPARCAGHAHACEGARPRLGPEDVVARRRLAELDG